MKDPRELSDDELLATARDWRHEALRGMRDARGWAHVYETEFRRRMGPAIPSNVLLDTRPLEARSRSQPWWKFW